MASYDTTPQVADLYSRIMIGAWDERQRIDLVSGFQAFFARPEYTGGETYFTMDPKAIDIDMQKGDEKLAPMSHRGIAARPIGSTTQSTNEPAFTSKVRRFPLIKEFDDISSDQTDWRQPGENPYDQGGNLRQRRLRRIAAAHHQEHQRRALRTCEYLASQALLTGLMPALLNTTDPDYIYDFNRDPSLTVSLATPWNNNAAFPLHDFDDMWELIRKLGKTNFDVAVLGRDSMKGFLGNTNVRSDADVRRYENITRVSNSFQVPQNLQKFVDSGMTPYGEVFTPAGHRIWLFTYDNWYQDDSLTYHAYMPEDQVFCASSTARTDRYFGPPDGTIGMIPQRIEFYRQVFGISPSNRPLPPGFRGSTDIIRPEFFFYDAYASSDWEVLTGRTQIAPIYAPIQANGFGLLTDVYVP